VTPRFLQVREIIVHPAKHASVFVSKKNETVDVQLNLEERFLFVLFY